MSLAGLAAVRGSTVTIKRSTRTANTDGTYDHAWAAVATAVDAPIEPITSELAQQIWGQETKATWRTVIPWDTDITVGDGLIVTAGNYNAQTFRVVEQLPRGMSPGTRHIEVGLEETPETFT